jgi:mevalonate kinase
MTTFSAPAKIILFGEHAVVYGHPAIAVPFSALRASAEVHKNNPPGQGLLIVAGDLQKSIRVEDAGNVLAEMSRLILKQLGASPPDVTISLRSTIPVASGLGSGAAIAAVLGRVLSAVVNHPLSDDSLNQIVYEIEKLHHGTPSGIDNTVVVYEQPIYFVRDQAIQRLKIGQSFQLVAADTGKSAPTRISVGDVRKLYEANPAKIQPVLNSIGQIVEQARQIIEYGNPDALGPLMLQNHLLLSELTVSSPELDALVDAAMNAGALGAKLSGGGRGGNMIALVAADTAEYVGQALLAAGAARIYHTTVTA